MCVWCRYKSVGKLSSGHQAAIMKLAIDDTDTADGNICVVTGAKDHYVKVSALCCSVSKCHVECQQYLMFIMSRCQHCVVVLASVTWSVSST